MFKMHRDGTIVLPQGDTMTQAIELTGREFPAGTIALFGVTEYLNARRRLTKTFNVENGMVTIELKPEDTRNIMPGEYMWDQRLITNPAEVTVSSATCSPNSTVLSVFAGGALPKMIITEVAADV